MNIVPAVTTDIMLVIARHLLHHALTVKLMGIQKYFEHPLILSVAQDKE